MVSDKISDRSLHSKVALLETQFDSEGLHFVGLQEGRARERSKVALLETQFDNEELHFVGLQEGRAREQGVYRADANERGCHGSLRFVANSIWYVAHKKVGASGISPLDVMKLSCVSDDPAKKHAILKRVSSGLLSALWSATLPLKPLHCRSLPLTPTLVWLVIWARPRDNRAAKWKTGVVFVSIPSCVRTA